MRVDLEEFKKATDYIKMINQTDLKDLSFYEGATEVKIKDEAYEQWQYCGMSNRDFIRIIIGELEMCDGEEFSLLNSENVRELK